MERAQRICRRIARRRGVVRVREARRSGRAMEDGPRRARVVAAWRRRPEIAVRAATAAINAAIPPPRSGSRRLSDAHGDSALARAAILPLTRRALSALVPTLPKAERLVKTFRSAFWRPARANSLTANDRWAGYEPRRHGACLAPALPRPRRRG
jgi:hypothetical protein